MSQKPSVINVYHHHTLTISQLSISRHVITLLNSCASVLYALRTLMAHDMRPCLHEVFRPTVLAKLYASPAWSGFCSAGDINKLDRFLNRCKSLNYCSQTTSHIAKLFDVADQSLLKPFLSNSHHVLHRLLPKNKILVYYLRSCAHNLKLANKSCVYNSCNSTIQILFKGPTDKF